MIPVIPILLLLGGAAFVASTARAKPSGAAAPRPGTSPVPGNPFLEVRNGIQFATPHAITGTKAFLDTRDADPELGAGADGGDLPMPPTGRVVELHEPGQGSSQAFNATAWVNLALGQGWVVLTSCDRPLLASVAQGHETLWCRPGGRWAVLAGSSL